MTQLKKTALTPGWDTVVFRTMVNIKQPKTEPFCSWMNGIRGTNFSLTDARFHKDAIALHSHLKSHISDDLVDFLASLSKNEHDRVESIKDLEEWLREMMEIDENMSKSCKHHLDLVEEAVKRQRTSYSSYCPSGSSFSYHSTQNVSSRSSSTSIASVTPAGRSRNQNLSKFSSLLQTKVNLPPGYRFPPKLTEAEHELLRIYEGCRV